MHRLSVGRDHRHAVSFDGHLSRTDGSKCIDQPEAIPTTRSDCEDLQRSVGHEAGVRITELASAVDQHRFGILAGVDGQSTGITFGGVLVQPVANQHDVGGQIKVVQMRVGIAGWWLANDHAAVETVDLLQTGVRVPEVGASVAGPLVSERKKRKNSRR